MSHLLRLLGAGRPRRDGRELLLSTLDEGSATALANRCEDEIEVEVVDLVARVGARRVREHQGLLFGFLHHARLAL